MRAPVVSLAALLAAAAAFAAPVPPDTPKGLSGTCGFSDGPQARLQVEIAWEESMPHTYLLAGYRIYRQQKGSTVVTSLASTDRAPYKGTRFVDIEGLTLSASYTYQVQALDTKGNSSAVSAPYVADLAALPTIQLAPRPPADLTAKPGRREVYLTWSPSQGRADKVSYYWVFRQTPGLPAPAAPKPVTQLAAVDSGGRTPLLSYADPVPESSRLYEYQVVAVDAGGRASASSATATAAATGTVPPPPPGKLTATPGEARMELAWEPSTGGSAPVSAYYVRRLEPGEAKWKTLSPLSASRTAYTDYDLLVKGAYRWQVLAVDLEGNSSAPGEVMATPYPEKPDKANIIMFPTAFTSSPDGDTGVNLGAAFSYFIGSLFQSYDNPNLGRKQENYFQPVRVGTFTGDFKYALIGPGKWTPGVAVGFYTLARIGIGQPTSGSSQNVVVTSSSNEGFRTMGGLYGVASQRFGRWLTLHVGAIRGDLANDLVRRCPPNWELTIRHVLPGDNVPDLLPSLVDSSLGVPVASSPHLVYGGLQLPFTLPLGFATWHSALRAEYVTPLDTSSASAEYQGPEYRPWMINVHFDHLPLFGFEFSYFKFFQGYQVLAFYHFHDLNWSF